MTDNLRLMCCLAHPDDESLGTGGTLAKYASEGVETYLVTATRGERGRFHHGREAPEVVARAREAELRAAAVELGVREVHFLDYVDGELDQADPREVIARITSHLRRIRPHVVVTFPHDGAYGHPDHIAICQFTTAAVVCAADPEYRDADGDAHRVSKLYYIAWNEGTWKAYQDAFKTLTSTVDGETRHAGPWPDWLITAWIDTAAFWPTVWRAVQCHKTQLPGYAKLEHLSEASHQGLWGCQTFYRVMSAVNGGRERETDLFAGLR